MSKQGIHSSQAPAAIGPYSQAVRAGDYVFFSGQIPLVPETGAVVTDDIAQQTERVMANMHAVLQAAGCTFANIVKTTIFLTDLQDFGVVNEIYGRYFEEPFPARATVQVAALPKGVGVEIEWVAYAPGKD